MVKHRTAASGLVAVAVLAAAGCGASNSNSPGVADQTPSQPATSAPMTPTVTPSKTATKVAATKPRPKPTPKPKPTPPLPQPSPRITPSKSPSPVQPPHVGAGTITITNYSFVSPTYVSPGARITVFNKDNVAHSVTSDQGSYFNVIVQAGQSATFIAPGSPGRYAFHCIYHGEMHGVLNVR